MDIQKFEEIEQELGTTLTIGMLDWYAISSSYHALKEDFIELIDRVSNKEFDLKLLLTGIYNLEDAELAFEDLANNQDKMIKSLIKIN